MVYLNTFLTSAALRPCAMESPRSERSAPSFTDLGVQGESTWDGAEAPAVPGENSVLICPEVEIFAVQAKERFLRCCRGFCGVKISRFPLVFMKKGWMRSMENFSEMYVIEALHEVPILESRIQKNLVNIEKYASGVNTMIPAFGTAAEQKKQVAAFVASTKDLINRLLYIKRCLAYTNSVSVLEIDGFKYSIVELLHIKSTACQYFNGIYASLNCNTGNEMYARAFSAGKNSDTAGTVSPVLYYDEKKKNEEADKMNEFIGKISSALEIFNARTKLKIPE